MAYSLSSDGVLTVTGIIGPPSDETQTALNAKQATLVNGTNIKTINGETVLGSGDLVVVGGSGITRFSSVMAISTTGGATANTDYVYVATVGVKFTLPTAIDNTNLYTIKNLSNSSVLVAVTAGQAIDGSDTVLMNNYESLSFISNSSVWGVL